ncbi:unnamed protein product [Rotaria socialis]|uniref:C2H2-type domain-containing protein n=1 Tax=Rotaria socialis TaxID=392032 RepID=A0A820C313_9BILA|nr:unnamed protein product [Rotaria socialis]CAF3439303.1 unnamed protein product [Rotaria socialis]CAF3540585.1 unnamed protein product [Rotaria socialis]CAF3619186.1 unnamed protein product [Rotaria socialis]CAF3734027.1 unnamed protein product [Rotaria socialis]
MSKEYRRKRQRVELQDKHQKSDNEQNSNLQKCLICNRHFISNRLVDHERACKQATILHTNSLHRYYYDSQLHRWKGLDYSISSNQSNTNRDKHQPSTKHFPQTHWREKHQQFQNIIKRQYNSKDDLIQSSDDRSYQCSLCQRKFATENAITKHRKGCTGNRHIGLKNRNIRNKSIK